MFFSSSLVPPCTTLTQKTLLSIDPHSPRTATHSQPQPPTHTCPHTPTHMHTRAHLRAPTHHRSATSHGHRASSRELHCAGRVLTRATTATFLFFFSFFFSLHQVELLTMMGFAIAVKSRKMASDLELYSTIFKFFHLVNIVMYATIQPVCYRFFFVVFLSFFFLGSLPRIIRGTVVGIDCGHCNALIVRVHRVDRCGLLDVSILLAYLVLLSFITVSANPMGVGGWGDSVPVSHCTVHAHCLSRTTSLLCQQRWGSGNRGSSGTFPHL